MRLLRLVVVLALTSGMGTVSAMAKGPRLSKPAQDSAALKAYINSPYTLCDAHFIARTFSMSQGEAKAYIGQKIQWGTTDVLADYLREARRKGRTDRQMRCQFYQTGFGYKDAEVLASFWGISVSDAKVSIEDKILDGNEAYVRAQLLPMARKTPLRAVPHAPVSGNGIQDPFQAFVSSKYDPCHANMLIGTYFGNSLSDTKTMIGAKVAAGQTARIESKLDVQRDWLRYQNKTACSFYMTPYTSADAQALARLWGTSLSDAKSRVQNKYLWGTEDNIRSELERARVSP
ncbi:MAG: hypothetical protein AB8H79_01055 [Myxococcota bacterium]